VLAPETASLFLRGYRPDGATAISAAESLGLGVTKNLLVVLCLSEALEKRNHW
jgi:hypothetical protein